jgi:flagellar motor switch protein FliN/FliY
MYNDENNYISEEEARLLLGNAGELALDVDEIKDSNKNIDRILEVNLELTVVIGRTTMQLKDILELEKGSLIELDALANQDVEVLINGKILAYGKVVVVDQHFGVRITSIVSEDDRVRTIS